MESRYSPPGRREESSFDTFLYKNDFDFSVHCHPEYELTYIISGEGTRIVGSQVENFYSNDLILLGSYLPHGWRNHEHSMETASASVIQWKEDFLGPNWYDIKEFGLVKNLHLLAGKGIKFSEQTALGVKDKFLSITAQAPLDKLITFLKILRELAYVQEYTIICEGEVDHYNREYVFLEERKEDLKK